MPKKNDIQLWRDANLAGGLELLRASCHDHRYPAHSHDAFVIAAFKSGAQKHRVARHVGIAYAGSVMIIPPGEVHTGEGAERNSIWEYCAFYPSAESLEKIADDVVGNGRGSLDFGKEVLLDDRIIATHLLYAHHIAETALDVLERQSAVFDAFALLIRRYGKRAATGRVPPLDADIRRAIEFMHEHHGGRLTVNQIATAAGLSEYHFMRTFRAKTGLTVHRYVTQLRLEQAKNLLENGVPAAETAITVGFFDQSHFTNQFRSNFGITPRQFSQACC